MGLFQKKQKNFIFLLALPDFVWSPPAINDFLPQGSLG